MKLPKGNVTAMCAVVALAVGSSDPSYGQCKGGLPDCNNNGVADECDIADGASGDCNGNGIPDECDITDSTSDDCNGDGRPDECGVIDDCEVASLTVSDMSNAGTWVARLRYIAADGDVVVVGARARGCCGVADVYRRRGGRLLLEQTLAPWDTQEQGGFGASVAVSGDVIIVGANGQSCTGSSLSCGAAYVFRHDGIRWVEQQILVPDVPIDGGRAFGLSLAAEGDRIVVGAPGGPAPSEAYVYRLDGDIWVEEQKLFGPACTTLPLFGISVAISNDVILVGDTIDCSGFMAASALSPPGFVYVYRLDGSGWLLEQAMEGGGYFGISVAVDGDLAVIGATIGTVDYSSYSGMAALVWFNGETWVEAGRLGPSDPSLDAQFGGSVSYNGSDLILVGASETDCAAGIKCGAAYVFSKVGANWVEERRLIPSPGIEFGRFGDSVAIVDNLVFVGESGVDVVHVLALGGQDCDCNGSADACDIVEGSSADCNVTGIPDSCELADGTSADCNANGLPDECEDCNGNGVADSCDITEGTSDDCDGNGVPDECEDCNGNGVADVCDIANLTSYDCTGNGIPDECEPDCNNNLTADSCDIDTGFSGDENSNAIPDECEEVPLADPSGIAKNRFISLIPRSEGIQTAIRVTLVKLYNTDENDEANASCARSSYGLAYLSSVDGETRWVGAVASQPETAAQPEDRFAGAALQCCPYFTDWVSDLYGIEETVLHVYGSGILPCSQYDVQVVSKTCLDLTDERCYSDILTIHTAKWGDVWPPFGGSGQPNFTDIGKVVDKFKDISPPLKVQAMLRGNVPPLDTPVNFTDIGRVVEAFKGLPYNEVGPAACSPCP